MTLPAGIYELTQDVKNPNGDARRKYDWTLEKVWKKGARFEVKAWDIPDGFGIRTQRQLYLIGSSASIPEHASGFVALAQFLIPVEETVDDILSTRHVDHRYVIKNLVKYGLVTLADVRKAVADLE